MRITQYNEPITGILPDGKRFYFRNRSEIIKQYGLTIYQIEDMLSTGSAFHTDKSRWGGKPRLCAKAEGMRFEYTIEK